MAIRRTPPGNLPGEGQWVQGRQPIAPVTSPGRTVTLNGQRASDTIDAGCNDPLVNDWTIVMQPTAGALARLAAGAVWDVRISVDAYHDSAKFFYWRGPFNSRPQLAPVTGLTLGVKGQRVRVGVYRGLVFDIPPGDSLDVYCAVVPRCPCKSNRYAQSSILAPAPVVPNPIAMFEIESLSRHFTFCTTPDPGDTFTFVQADGVSPSSLAGTYGVSDALVGKPIPIVYDAAYIVYGRDLLNPNVLAPIIDFETWF